MRNTTISFMVVLFRHDLDVEIRKTTDVTHPVCRIQHSPPIIRLRFVKKSQLKCDCRDLHLTVPFDADLGHDFRATKSSYWLLSFAALMLSDSSDDVDRFVC